MTLMSWSGAVATVADRSDLIAVDCSALLSALAPLDAIELIERMEVRR